MWEFPFPRKEPVYKCSFRCWFGIRPTRAEFIKGLIIERGHMVGI